jgi:hypothetical protein
MRCAVTGDNTDKESQDEIADVEAIDDATDNAADSATGDATDENVVLTTDDDKFADTVVEANVDALVARMDSKDADEVAHKRDTREKLEKLQEQQDKNLDGTFNFNLDDDL